MIQTLITKGSAGALASSSGEISFCLWVGASLEVPFFANTQIWLTKLWFGALFFDKQKMKRLVEEERSGI